MTSRRILWLIFLVVVVGGVFLVYRGGEKRAPATPVGAQLQIAVPLGSRPFLFPQITRPPLRL
ncbi:MAG TPA: hypothetical protein VKR26_17070 [Terriglobales bacterium]|nr:hypothetical protein [Terriglobales bacterium]